MKKCFFFFFFFFFLQKWGISVQKKKRLQTPSPKVIFRFSALKLAQKDVWCFNIISIFLFLTCDILVGLDNIAPVRSTFKIFCWESKSGFIKKNKIESLKENIYILQKCS